MLKFDFEFYDERRNSSGRRIVTDHERLFRKQIADKNLGAIKKLDDLKKSGLEFDEIDFVIYSLFRHQHNDRTGFRNYSEIQDSAYHRINDFSNFYEFSKTVRNVLTQKQDGSDRTYSEYQGVAGSLILTNELFGLTNADYKTIAEDNKKVMDFECELASTGRNFIKIESKGVSGLTRNISQEANSILEKKSVNNYQSKERDLYYGVITKIPFNDENGNGKVILVDPPIDDINLDPLKYKIHTRLSYYLGKIGLLIHGRIFEFLGFLLKYLESTTDKEWLFVYNRLATNTYASVRSYLTPFYYQCERIIIRIDRDESRVIRGHVDFLDEKRFIFYGILDNVLHTLINPTDEALNGLNYSRLENLIFEVPEITVKSVRLKREFSNEGQIRLSGNVKIYSTGEVFGILKQI